MDAAGAGAADSRQTMTPSPTTQAGRRAELLMAISSLPSLPGAVRPLEPVAMRLVPFEVPDQGVDVGSRIPEVEKFRLDEALVDSALKLRPQRIEEAVEVQDGHGFPMVAELLQGQRLQHLLHRAEPARQRHEGITPLGQRPGRYGLQVVRSAVQGQFDEH